MFRHHETTTETGSQIAGIANVTNAASVSLLNDIDVTIDSLTRFADLLARASCDLSTLTKEVSTTKVVESNYIDVDDIAIDLLEKTTKILKEVLPIMVRKRKSIDVDCRLKQHHCESLHDAYERVMDETADLIDIVETARSAIITHDLKAEPRDSQVFETVDALLFDLHQR